jgi:hypothetical protein
MPGWRYILACTRLWVQHTHTHTHTHTRTQFKKNK